MQLQHSQHLKQIRGLQADNTSLQAALCSQQKQNSDMVAEVAYFMGVREYYEGRLGQETWRVSQLRVQLRSAQSGAEAARGALVAAQTNNAGMVEALARGNKELIAAQGVAYDLRDEVKAAKDDSLALRKQLVEAKSQLQRTC